MSALVILGTQYSENHYWLYILLAKLPSLLFFTAFSFFIYFFARIVMEEEADSSNLLKPFFFVFNILTYVFFFGMAIYSNSLALMTADNGYIYYINSQFLKALCGLFGVVYLIFAICMTNYGTRLALILSNLFENSEAEEREILNSLNYRVIFMTKVVVSVHSLPRDEVLKEAVGKASFFLLRASEVKLLVEHSILLIEKLKEPFSC